MCISRICFLPVWSMLNCVVIDVWMLTLYDYMQITEKKPELAKYEAADCGKPLDEAAWDIVCLMPMVTFSDSLYRNIY